MGNVPPESLGSDATMSQARWIFTYFKSLAMSPGRPHPGACHTSKMKVGRWHRCLGGAALRPCDRTLVSGLSLGKWPGLHDLKWASLKNLKRIMVSWGA